jgi:hypothetical protein
VIKGIPWDPHKLQWIHKGEDANTHKRGETRTERGEESGDWRAREEKGERAESREREERGERRERGEGGERERGGGGGREIFFLTSKK